MSKNKHWIIPDWPAPKTIHAATTLRTGGVSSDAFSSLNPADHVGDDEESVKQNRAIIKTMLALPSEPVWLSQTHSNCVVDAATVIGLTQADASYTGQASVVCAVMTADCLPLLICANDGSQVAAIHAGWRGLCAGIISNTLAVMQTKDVLIWLGPAIGPDCFEVGNDVYEAFSSKSTNYSTAFKHQNNGKWLADIYQIARIELAALGVTAINGGDYCTLTDKSRFFSYRREQQTGRMATLIWID
jgi:YfiH family protein